MNRTYQPGDRVTDVEEVFYGTVKAVLPTDPDLYEVDWDGLGQPRSTSIDHVDNLRPAGDF